MKDTIKTVTIRLPAELHARVTELVEKSGDSFGQVGRQIFESHFKSSDLRDEISEVKTALAVTEKRILASIADEIE